ncbi:hypothetical protein D3H55_16750 [Bacillus salacetis]|uniref:Uncharacterized protein n=1 Tax=Bacillus salacetis TaxID=2315464 RepID=A0A3A1QSM1_9BACI|nr:hypothetical protein [Bacillus salacetis]RIW30387.1 hypothetical protein D3H55_16750 [Bacillus salacetis]
MINIRTLGKFALYDHKEYRFLPQSDGSFALISTNSSDLHKGFKKIGEIHENRYLKEVHLEELSLVFQKKTSVRFKGDLFIGSAVEGDEIMLYTRDVSLGKKHNMKMRDKDEYYQYINLKDIEEITQQWIPIPDYNVKERD